MLTHARMPQSADQLLVSYVGLAGWADSEIVGWIVKKGSPAFWKTEVPLFSSSAHTYMFDSYSKWSSFPSRPHTAEQRMGSGRERGPREPGEGGMGSQWKRIAGKPMFERVG